jgi:broad specificity phosphatase PhoE
VRRFALALLACVALQGAAQADEKVWAALKAGGHVILMRHGLTTPGVGDPEGMRLEDCATQRNLNDEGRHEARAAGDALRKRKVPVGRVLSSPWCRCIETATLAFGRMDEVSPPLANLFGRPENREKQVAAMRKLVSERIKGGNLVLVSHGSTISALTGVAPATAEMVVVTPRGGGKFEVVGRVLAHRP